MSQLDLEVQLYSAQGYLDGIGFEKVRARNVTLEEIKIMPPPLPMARALECNRNGM